MTRSLLAPLLAPVLALGMALPSPTLAETPSRGPDASREAMQARNLALGLAALAAVTLAVRAADRDDVEEDENGRVVPSACLRPFGGRQRDDGAVLLHDLDCLDAHVERVGDLPLSCAVTLRTFEGFETGFDPGCLAEEGWGTD